MSFYWVNLGDTYKEVLENSYLWSPDYAINKNGKREEKAGWRYVSQVKRDDTIFCHENGKIICVGTATEDAFPAPRPVGRSFDRWNRDGHKILLKLYKLVHPILTDTFKEEFIFLFNDKTNPKLFTKDQSAAQQYLVSLPDAAGAFLLDLLGEESLAIDSQKKSEPKPLKKTTKETIVQARIGQGKFREDVLSLWGSACPVTGIDVPPLLIASHILSWQLSNDLEKIDPHNGISLSPNVDKLFDRGIISFSNDGSILLSDKISIINLEKLGLTKDSQINSIRKEILPYLAKHRALHGFQE